MEINRFSGTMTRRFGCKVYRLALSSGCTCPNRDGTLGSRGCIFCDGAGAFSAAGTIAQQLRQARARVAHKAGQGKYVAYFQSFTNTYGPVERLRPLFEAAMAPEDVVALAIATRPDCLGPEVLAMLRELGRVKPLWVELGLQTIHSASAEWIRRGYDLSCYDRAVEALHAIGAEVVTHMILGLPGETEGDMAATAAYIGRSGAEGIKLHLLHVLRGTDLAEAYRRGEVEVMTLESYIRALEQCIVCLPPEMVIHRLTGDGAKRDLIAPLWSGDKKRVLNAVHRAFETDGIVQGSRWEEAKRPDFRP